MKKIIAIVALIASAQASAFTGNNMGNGAQNGNGALDAAGNGSAEASFSISFSGKGKSDFRGNGTATNAADLQNAVASSETTYTAPVVAK